MLFSQTYLLFYADCNRNLNIFSNCFMVKKKSFQESEAILSPGLLEEFKGDK